MSSFTSEVSLRRRCVISTSSPPCIISTQGPFLEYFWIEEWEDGSVPEKPNRLKLFSDLGAYIDTVLPLGSTGHFITISHLLKDNVNKEWRAYAAFVRSCDIVSGGYTTPSDRFVISCQPWTESPCSPIVAISADTNKLYVLTSTSFKIYQLKHNTDKVFAFAEFYNTSFKNPKLSVMKPLHVASSDIPQFAILDKDNRVCVSTYSDENSDMTKFQEIEKSNVSNAVTATHFIPDVNVILIGEDKVLRAVPLLSETAKEGDSIHVESGSLELEEQIIQLEVVDDSIKGNKIVFAMSKKIIFILRLSDCKWTEIGQMKCETSSFTACAATVRTPYSSVDDLQYIFLAVACENGDLRFVDATSYMEPRQSLLPSSSEVATEIVSFFPAYKVAEEGDEVGNLEGIYAVTSTGQFIYRTSNGSGPNHVVTTLIANNMVDMTSYCNSVGRGSLVTYGRQSVHLYPIHDDLPIKSAALTTESIISQCFASHNHFLLCTADEMVLVDIYSRRTEFYGIATPPIKLDEIHNISAYGAFLGGDYEEDLQLSIIGTSNGRVYCMTVKEEELHARKFGKIQELIKSRPTNQFLFAKGISSPFIDSNNERIVSIVSALIEPDGYEIMILGAKGSLVRFYYGRDEEVVVTQSHAACQELSHLSFRSLIPIREENDYHGYPLIVAYEAGTKETDVQSILIHLLDLDTKESLFSFWTDRLNGVNLHKSDEVHVYRSTDVERGKVTVISLCTKQTTKKKTNKDSFLVVEGVLKRCQDEEIDEDTRRAVISSMQSLHISSRIDDKGKRETTVLGVSDDAIDIATMTPKSALERRHALDMAKSSCEPCCSALLATPNLGSFLFLGCHAGEVLLLEKFDHTRCATPICIDTEESRVIQIAAFAKTESDRNELMFVVLLEKGIKVYRMDMHKAGEDLTTVSEWSINMNARPDDYRLYAMGSRFSLHDIWLCGKRSLVVWRGKEGRFDKAQRKEWTAAGLEGDISATAAICVVGHDEKSIKTASPAMEIVCVGTKKGEIAWFYIVNAKEHSIAIQHTRFDGMKTEIKALEGMIIQSMHLVDVHTLHFEVCMYALTARRVTVSIVKVDVMQKGLALCQAAQHQLYHFVRDPSLLAIERCLRKPVGDRELVDRTRRLRDLPQRVIVASENEMETLLMCPYILYQFEPELEVRPLAMHIRPSTPLTTHTYRNTTNRDIRVIRQDGSSAVLKPYHCALIAFNRMNGSGKREKTTTKYQVTTNDGKIVEKTVDIQVIEK